ncbi:MAG TPA: hypothetical protein VFH27_13030 [Longimicrobiaceae bacterium]|nr:hypothetical protein [Longimicrobiaceae bacterium]
MQKTLIAVAGCLLAGCSTAKLPQTLTAPAPATALDCAREQATRMGYTVHAMAPSLHAQRAVAGHDAKFDEMEISMLTDGTPRLQVVARTTETENGSREMEKTSEAVHTDALRLLAACGTTH